jgi:hypothetical protein
MNLYKWSRAIGVRGAAAVTAARIVLTTAAGEMVVGAR